MPMRLRRSNLKKTFFYFLGFVVWASVMMVHSTKANRCTPHITTIEFTQYIPQGLLAAMARVESGRWNKINRRVEPWPWTISVQGKGQYYATKHEALIA